MTSRLDMAVAKAVPLLLELRHIEADLKLAPASFLLEALQAADCTPERLDEVAGIIEAKAGGLPAVMGLLRRSAKEFLTDNIRRPPFSPEKLSKWCRFVGAGDSLATELQSIKCTLGEVVALAARRAVAKAPQAFGSNPGPWDTTMQKIEALRREIDEAKAQMRAHFEAADVRLDQRTLSRAAAQHGAMTVTLRRWPSVTIDTLRDWPQEVLSLAADELATKKAAETKPAAPKPKPGKRVKIEPAEPAAA